MITYNEAKSILIHAGANYNLKTMAVDTHEIDGHVCAKKMSAPITVQPFDNSAMDGFALRYEDLLGAEENNVISLNKVIVIAAGDDISGVKINSGECAQIMTGAPVPDGADAVVPIELVKVDGDCINYTQEAKRGAHIRLAGEDFKKGQVVMQGGQMLDVKHIMPLASLGIAKVKVFKKPLVVVLTTGKELVDDLSQELQSGQIYNSNGPYVREAIKSFGADTLSCGSVADDMDVFKDKLKCIIRNDVDIAISTGAVSAGAFDFVKKGLEDIGAEILFHKVLIRPGKPILFAKLPNGTLYFGLPGNPAASAACLRFFVYPLIRSMRMQAEETPIHAKLMTPFSKKKDFRMFLKARAESWDDGFLTVDLLDGQASFMVSPFLQMNCWAVSLDGEENLKAGDIIDIFPLWGNSNLL